MSDSEDANMDPTPRRRRRSKDLDPPDMSGDSSREQDDEETEMREEQERLRREEEERLKREEEERLRREEEERLKREEEERLKRKEEEERLRREEEEERLKRKEEEERLKREEERLSALEFKEEMKKIQEFVQRFPDQLKETESAVEELKKVADDIHNERDAVVGGARASSFIRTGAAIAAVGVIGLAGAGLATFTGGASVAVAGAVAGGLTQAIAGGTVAGMVAGGSTLALASGTVAASIGAFTLRSYSKKIEDICENARRRMTELSRSATTAIAALLNLKRLSGSPDTAADSDYEKVFEMLETDSGLRDLTERMEELLGASGTDTADSQIDQIAEIVFPNDLGQLFSVILSFKSKEEKNEKASKICECAEKLEENLQAVREIHTAMKTLSN
ncbi:cyclic nucleotide-gated cation channel beta-1-like [Acipenser ruthenus]|uniref:cyclic nucleotide-gated cation channel beta-1-like n=1 Tax=Acipenser ruthenus TaxID=7906 RepID=UPI0027415DDD|nr:cyclic nucleotide-gated cation channel beta-1-like [Acipenser ruthenus]XP_058874962.1 cyclic nucleotide-gated cation channel beta-1-like [Acipenser ruthenus]